MRVQRSQGSLKRLQAEQVEMRSYEYSPLADIQRWSDIPAGTALFDSFCLFQNYAVEDHESLAALQVDCNHSVTRATYALQIVALNRPDLSIHVAAPPPEHDRVLATVLFTDIVGSTERASALGDRAWKELLERHHALVRHELSRFRGREINTAGDGFLATFDGPARAVRCAQAIVQAVQAIGMEVRAGVHTGEVELMGEDVGGIAVHIGARVAAMAAPSQVLVSGTVRDLVAGSGIEFEDRGTFR